MHQTNAHQSKAHQSNMAARPRRPGILLVWSVLLALGTLFVGSGLLSDLTTDSPSVLMAGPGLHPLDDFDGDGIPNVADNEFQSCEPTVADSDDDGYGDGYELATGSDPYDFNSIPEQRSGVRILVAPEGDDVYIVFLMGSEDRFVKPTSHKILFVPQIGGRPVGVAIVDVTSRFLKQIHRNTSVSGRVVSWTLRARRCNIAIWSLGFGMREDDRCYFDGIVVQQRSNNRIMTARYDSEGESCTVALQHTEPDSNSGGGGGPKSGGGTFEECEQVSYCSSPGSPIRHVVSEKCETRDTCICPPDCGAMAGQMIIDLKKWWLY